VVVVDARAHIRSAEFAGERDVIKDTSLIVFVPRPAEYKYILINYSLDKMTYQCRPLPYPPYATVLEGSISFNPNSQNILRHSLNGSVVWVTLRIRRNIPSEPETRRERVRMHSTLPFHPGTGASNPTGNVIAARLAVVVVSAILHTSGKREYTVEVMTTYYNY
jgi:hypothetical protein